MKNAIILTIIVVCIGLMFQYPHTLLSPGELAEGHQKLNDKCLSCHNPFWGISNDKCISCHKLSDIGKDDLILNEASASSLKLLFHQNLSNLKCTSCHTDHKGLKSEMSSSGFRHELLPETILNKCNSCHGKPSDNIHLQISASCSSCHHTEGWKSSVVFNHDLIQGTDKNNCSSCHNKPTDNLHGKLTSICIKCHSTEGWKSSVLFNHDMIQEADRSNCSSCHQKPTDSYHHLFKDNCDKCHTTSKWTPSTFDHSNYFRLDNNHSAKCIVCHTDNNFNAYTCFGCHEHSQNKIMEEHNEHGISNFSNCSNCHRSGNEHDIRMNQNSNQELNQNELKNVKKYIKSKEKYIKKEDGADVDHDGH